MSRYEDVLIDTDVGIGAVATRIEQLLGAPTQLSTTPSGDLRRAFLLGEDHHVVLDESDLVDDLDLPLSTFHYDLEVGAGSVGEQEQLAREIYDKLAAGTDWRLMLLFDDAGEFVAQRDRLVTAGR
jgi:hypothetical protein